MTKHEDPANLPGDHDDPRSSSTMYWMTLMFVAMLVSCWALQGLGSSVQNSGERTGAKAPGAMGGGEVARVNSEHAADLETSIAGDVLTLTNGTVINAGLVYEVKDPEDDTVKVFVKEVPFMKIFAKGRESDFAKFTVVQGGKALKFLPGEVSGVEKGRGKKLTVPLSQAQRTFLATQGRG